MGFGIEDPFIQGYNFLVFKEEVEVFESVNRLAYITTHR